MITKNKISLKIARYFFTLIFAYAAYASFFYLTQRSILFPSEYADIPIGVAENIPDSLKFWIEAENGRSETWYFPPGNITDTLKYPLMIIAHGNADLIDRWADLSKSLSEKGIGILLVEYPGYGRSTGDPSQRSITEVFTGAYDYIIRKPEIDVNRIILFGQSVGGGAVSALAEKRPSSALILVSTFTHVGIFASDFFLPEFLVKDSFDNLSVISNYKKPVLLLHGTKDNLIPYEESEKLMEVSERGKLIPINGGHNLRLDKLSFWEEYILPFLNENDFIETSGF